MALSNKVQYQSFCRVIETIDKAKISHETKMKLFAKIERLLDEQDEEMMKNMEKLLDDLSRRKNKGIIWVFGNPDTLLPS